MQLTPHFTLAELTASNKATALGIDNTPPPELLPELQHLAELLERIRTQLGAPITVTSGYRGPVLNKSVSRVTSRRRCTPAVYSKGLAQPRTTRLPRTVSGKRSTSASRRAVRCGCRSWL